MRTQVRTLHNEFAHFRWDREFQPQLHVEPTELLEFRVSDASGGQLTRRSTARDVARMNLQRTNPVVGPVYVQGAEPGDAVEVEFLEFEIGQWGWTAIIPGFGLLQKDFPDAYLHVSGYDANRVEFTPEIHLPTRPFVGTVGLAPAEAGSHSLIPPRRVGGNLDCGDLVKGSKLLLPVEVPGALLSIGDPHAAQGDGEVCGTAVETSMHVQVRVRLHKQVPMRGPIAQLPGQTTPRGSVLSTMGVASDLMHACQDAVRSMIDHIVGEYGLSPELAYCLCSTAVGLRVSEVVDAPNWVVSAHLPNGVFR
jgi:formamidase